MTRPMEMKRLSFLEGTWVGFTTNYLAPGGGGVKRTCKRIYIPRLRGRILMSSYDETGSDGGLQGVEILTWDPTLQCFRSLWFDNTGRVDDARGKFADEKKLVLYFSSSADGRDQEGRVTYSMMTPDEFTLDVDLRTEGSDWKPVLECRLQRSTKA